MSYNDIHDHRDGHESISTMWIEDKRLLCRKLDARHRWKDLAGQEELRLTQDDVLLLAQAAPRESPSEGLFNVMSEKRTSMLELYQYLQQADLLAAMKIVQKYVPPQYYMYTESDGSLDPNGAGPYDVPEPLVPPPLSPSASNPGPMSLMAPQDFLQAGLPSGLPGMSLEDSLMSVPQDLDSTQIRAAHTIMATRNFDIADIARATGGFSEEYLISKGAYGSIYKVNLENTEFAAKVYNLDYKSVLSDLQETRHHNHENIVPITGKCLNGGSVILLYEYMTNGSLRHQLDSRGILNMDRRVTILRGAAKGIQYLHSNKPSALLHRNIKSSNILLDDGLKAKLSDFGMAVHVNKSSSAPPGINSSQCYTHFSTLEDTSALQRNKGYCPREVVDNGRFSEKSDTYSFGVVIFEACTGLKAYEESRSIANRELADYIENTVKQPQDMWDLRDRSIRWEQKTYFKLFHLAQLATKERAKRRPTMQQVYSDLDEIFKAMQTDKYDSDEDDSDELGPMSTLPPMQSEYHPMGPCPATPVDHHPIPGISLPAPGIYANVPPQHEYYNLPPGTHHQPALSQEPTRTQSLPPGRVDTQVSVSDSSLTFSEPTQSMTEEEADLPPSSSVSGSNMIHREVAPDVFTDDSYKEHPTSDFPDSCPSVGESLTSNGHMADVDLQQYLKNEEVRRTKQLGSEEVEEEGAELDPDLLAELEVLNLQPAG